MPNHIHVLLLFGEVNNERPISLFDVMRAYKSITTKRYNALMGRQGTALWQPRFFDHIVRDEADYLRIWKYIDENQVKWNKDRYYGADGN